MQDIEALLEPWGRGLVGRTAPSDSDITDDHSPVEFSIALNGSSPEIRILFETLTDGTTQLDSWEAAKRLNEVLAERNALSLERLRLVEDLFIPTDDGARFAMWHSYCLSRDGKPHYKVYLNPQAQGKDHASAVLAEAMRRLGFSSAAEQVTTLTREGDELKFFSLDLDPSPTARAKVYKVHHNATSSEIAQELSIAPAGSADEVRRFCEAISGSAGPYNGLPVSTYLSMTAGNEAPTTATVHFPVRAYAANDLLVHARVARLLDEPEREIFSKAVASFARRRLDAGVGMQSYISFRKHSGPPRLTIYLSPELYHVVPAVMSTRVHEDVRHA